MVKIRFTYIIITDREVGWLSTYNSEKRKKFILFISRGKQKLVKLKI